MKLSLLKLAELKVLTNALFETAIKAAEEDGNEEVIKDFKEKQELFNLILDTAVLAGIVAQIEALSRNTQ